MFVIKKDKFSFWKDVFDEFIIICPLCYTQFVLIERKTPCRLDIKM
ncbi:hypothetical protein ATHSA_1705 [Athalassotoga saccharophila]|nr:hypothetical protein ATHSA_1705 [Athalassotoga saccharophila]